MTQLRPVDDIMRMQRLGAMFPSRLSFLRSMIRQLIAEKSTLTRPHFDVDADGYGTAVYTISLGNRPYSLFAITRPLDPEMRTDRVIASAWDAAFVLYDGIPDAAEIKRLAQNAPLQEGGRFTEKDLCLSRANKSVRLFDAVSRALKTGGDLPLPMIHSIGYLMRTTAVYGNGKFGISDRAEIENRMGLDGPFRAEMLTVWMIRSFTHDLIEHIGGAKLPLRIKRHLGIGNSTGLGMAPFLVSHPALLHAWINARETALTRVRTATVTQTQAEQLMQNGLRVCQHLLEWNVDDADYASRIKALRRDWAQFYHGLSVQTLIQKGALDKICAGMQNASTDLQELISAWIIEPFGDLIDDLCDGMSLPEQNMVDANQSCEGLRKTIEDKCAFALAPDFNSKPDTAQFWYISEAKLEPRMGQRYEEDGAEWESPLDIARRIQMLHSDLQGQTGPLWQFLLQNPQHSFAALRVQNLAQYPYAEIHDNLISAQTAPIDMLRCKLSFFGASKFDPKSKLWTRVTLAQGAPLAEDLASQTAADDWWLPVFAPMQGAQ